MARVRQYLSTMPTYGETLILTLTSTLTLTLTLTQLRAVRMQQLESLNDDGFDVPRLGLGLGLGLELG
jgi:hypothetical protein